MAPSANRKSAVAAEAWRSIFDFIVATAPQRNRYIGEIGLTPNDSRALQSLSVQPERTMGSLAEEWKCDASTATRQARFGSATARDSAARTSRRILRPR